MTVRVLHVLDHSIPLLSGYAIRTLSILGAQRRLGWETFHLTSSKHPGSQALSEDVDGWHFFRTPGAERASIIPGVAALTVMRRLERRLATVASELKPAILHAHSPVLNAIPAIRVGRRLGIPVVYEVRAFWEDAAVDQGTARAGGPRYRLTQYLETLALRRVQHVFTICEGLRGDILTRGVEPGRVTVIPNSVDLESLVPKRTADDTLRHTLGLSGCIVLGYFGSFHAYEGLGLLLDALPALSEHHPVRVMLVGEGPQEQALRERARRLGVTDKVIFTAHVPHSEIPRYYDLLDLAIYPRRAMRLTDLVTPIKPLEAMALQTLVVASDVGGHRELIRDGETGHLFRAGDVAALTDKVLTLLRERERWPQTLARARTFVETERSWSHTVRGYVEPYRRTIGLPD